MSLMGANGGQAPTDIVLIAELDRMNLSWKITPSLETPLALVTDTLGEILGISAYATNTYPIKDPTGGKPVCLNVDGVANQPCQFDYVKYDDGTYSISYGIESKASMEKNYYQTTFIATEDA